MWDDSIKIITGIRRCGKSYLLKYIFIDYLKSIGVPDKNIITFAFDSALDLEKIGEDLIELVRKKQKIVYLSLKIYFLKILI